MTQKIGYVSLDGEGLGIAMGITKMKKDRQQAQVIVLEFHPPSLDDPIRLCLGRLAAIAVSDAIDDFLAQPEPLRNMGGPEDA